LAFDYDRSHIRGSFLFDGAEVEKEDRGDQNRFILAIDVDPDATADGF
jgi:hypothetical protein